MTAAVGGAPLLAEDLGRQCFLGFEDAGVEELRGMVRLFSSRAAQVGVQQRMAFERLASTSKTVALAQKRLQELHNSELAAEERADDLVSELNTAHQQLEDTEHRNQRATAQVSAVRAELQEALLQAADARAREAAATAVAQEAAEARSKEEAATAAELARAADLEASAELHRQETQRALEELSAARAELAACQRAELPSVPLPTSGEHGGCSDLGEVNCSWLSNRSPFSPTSLRYSAATVDESAHNWTVTADSEATKEALQTAAPKRPAFAVTQDPSVAPSVRTKSKLPQREDSTCLQVPAAAGASRMPVATDDDDITLVDLGVFSDEPDTLLLADPPAPKERREQEAIDSLAQSGTSQAAARRPGASGAGLRYLLGRRSSPGQAAGVADEDACLIDDVPEPQESWTEVSMGTSEAHVGSVDGKFNCPTAEADQDAHDAEGETQLAGSAGAAGSDAAGQAADVIAGGSLLEARNLRASWAAPLARSDLAASTEALVDQLYEECIARGGGQLRGAVAVRRVLLDLAGDSGGSQSDDSVPPELDGLLSQLGSSLDAEVSRTQFRAVVREAFALRQSQEVRRYCENTGQADDLTASTARLDGACAEPSTSLRNSARLLNRWASLPSWSSMELGRLSTCGDSGHGASFVEALGAGASETTSADHWKAVEAALEQLHKLAEDAPQPLQGGGREALPDAVGALQAALTAFVRTFADEARARLRAAHASTGRLLDQRRRVVDDLHSQLEVRDAALHRSMEESAGLEARLRAASERAERAEKLAADTASDLAAARAAAAAAEAVKSTQAAAATTVESLSASVTSLGPEVAQTQDRNLQGLADMVTALRTELDAAERQRDAAEAARREMEGQFEVLAQRYEEDAQTFRAGARPISLAGSMRLSASLTRPLSTGAPGSTAAQPGSLLTELEGVAHGSSLERALEAEAAMRSELEAVRGELQLLTEEEGRRLEAQAASVAAEAAAVEERTSEMHGGTWFEKVSFKRSLKQKRFMRLSFDLRRIEWAQHERGPFKVLSVDAILRVDYGDASRTFRNYEFGRKDRPAAVRCFSISTPSRSLDLIASSEREVEVWVLGLNEVVPYRMERQRFTAQDYLVRRAILRLETSADQSQACIDEECGSNTSSRGVSEPTITSGPSFCTVGSGGSKSKLRGIAGRFGLR